jgi:tRNA threonylcarbamoyladenosine biosynthesis protein TsaB
MNILTIRTDKPDAEIGLYVDDKQQAYEVWQAYRELSNTIHLKIKDLISSQNLQLNEIDGIVCFKGPGSFTGLRIGITVGNTMSYALNVPIVARQDPKWLEIGIKDMLAGQNDIIALPEYGAEAKTTIQKK